MAALSDSHCFLNSVMRHYATLKRETSLIK